jgi:3-oxocholest-4-en-26-oate---CoA ligase
MEHNLAGVHEAIAAAVGDRECIVSARRRLTWAEVTDRTRRLGAYLRSRGLGCHTGRDSLAGWESGQDHVGLYMLNGHEYLEGMLGAFKARTAPFNVNYRYVAEELIYLLRDAKARGLVYHAAFAPRVAEIRGELPDLEVLVQVDEGSGHGLLAGAGP